MNLADMMRGLRDAYAKQTKFYGITLTQTEVGPMLAQYDQIMKALRDIGQIAVEPGADPMKALQAAQDIANTARAEVGDAP